MPSVFKRVAKLPRGHQRVIAIGLAIALHHGRVGVGWPNGKTGEAPYTMEFPWLDMLSGVGGWHESTYQTPKWCRRLADRAVKWASTFPRDEGERQLRRLYRRVAVRSATWLEAKDWRPLTQKQFEASLARQRGLRPNPKPTPTLVMMAQRRREWRDYTRRQNEMFGVAPADCRPRQPLNNEDLLATIDHVRDSNREALWRLAHGWKQRRAA